MLNLLLIEDDLDLAETLVEYLAIEGLRCDHASNGMSGLHFIHQQHYDVILLDINLPKLDGLSLCQQIRTEGIDKPVLMLTARDQLEDKLEGFRAGTDDYLVKPFELSELVVRCHALARRRSGQIKRLTCGDLEMNLTDRTVLRDGHLLHLSPTSWRLLEALLRASPEAVSRRALEESLWGDNVPDSNSLKVHIFNLRKAVNAGFGSPLIHTVPGFGFVLRETKHETPH